MSKNPTVARSGEFPAGRLSGIGPESLPGGVHGTIQLAVSSTPARRSARKTTNEGDCGYQGSIWDVADLCVAMKGRI